ncbi:MAG: hypothetical protein B7X48_13235, partial [Acidiphilium sp. 34-60-192]
ADQNRHHTASRQRGQRNSAYLVTAAAKTWRKLNGEKQLPKVIQGITFRNGVEVIETPAQNAA